MRSVAVQYLPRVSGFGMQHFLTWALLQLEIKLSRPPCREPTSKQFAVAVAVNLAIAGRHAVSSDQVPLANACL